MNEVNQFYSTYLNHDTRHEYDIRDLGEERHRGMESGTYIDGRFSGGKAISSPTTPKDYDEEFFIKLIKIKPPYKIHDFLDYHYEAYRNSLPDKNLFILHIQYVILPLINQTHRPEYSELTTIWINNKNKMSDLKNLFKKNEFLKKAYNLAVEQSPSRPLSVNINPTEFGKKNGFDETNTIRIMEELVHDGYVESSIGMKSLFLTQNGLNYLNK